MNDADSPGPALASSTWARREPWRAWLCTALALGEVSGSRGSEKQKRTIIAKKTMERDVAG